MTASIMYAIQFAGRVLGLLAGLALVTTISLQAQQLTMIAHANGAPEEMSMDDVRQIFKAKQQWWKNGTRVSLAMVKNNADIAPLVARDVFDMNVNEVRKYWVQIVFQGKASLPNYFDTEDQVLSFIQNTPGAVGIISAGQPADGARIIKVDGKEAW